MVPKVVYRGGSDEAGVQGGLFKGIKFWLSLRVPQRARFIGEVQANGGEVLSLENQADIKIVDHAKKEALPGTYSYTYIEKSIHNGMLESLEDHVVGPPKGTIRSIGSTSHPAKTQRTKFTEEDDRILWNWVHESQQKGGSTNGNDIYYRLEATNPQHTWQSWRNRWVKNLRFFSQTSFAVSNARPVPTSNQPLTITEFNIPQKEVMKKLKRKQDFSKEEVRALYGRGGDLLKIVPESVEDAWEEWALEFDPEQNHSASEWRKFWEKVIRPRYQARNPTNSAMRPSSSKKRPSSIPSRCSSFPVESRSGSVSSSSESQQTESSDRGNPLTIDVLRSDPSDSQQSFYPSLEAQKQNHDPLNRGSTESEEIPSSSPEPASRKRVFKNISSSPPPEILNFDPEGVLEIPSSSLPVPMKRKRKAFEEIQNSLSLESDYPSKKRRQENISLPIEIASTPDQTPLWNHTVASSEASDDEHLPTVDDMVDEIFDEMRQSEVDESSDQESTQEANEAFGRQASPILSQPNNATRPIETVSQDLTQSIDLDIPPPEEGWDDKEDALEHTNSPQVDDLDQAEINARLDAWIDGHVASGWSADEAISALECTSLDHCLANEVLEYMKVHQGRIPPERRGVWTEGDGEDLESTDARRILRAGEKHGRELVRLRWGFLAAYQR